MDSQHLEARLASIERKVNALLAVEIARLQQEDADLAPSRHPSIDALLDSAGLSGKEIADLLGKTQRAVSNQLSSARKSRGQKGS